MFKYGEPFEPIMNKLLVILITAIIMIGLIGTTMTVPQASYATKQSKQVPPEKTTVTPKDNLNSHQKHQEYDCNAKDNLNSHQKHRSHKDKRNLALDPLTPLNNKKMKIML